MAEIKITLELSKEDRQRLEVIGDTLELIRLALTNAGTPFPAIVATLESTDEPAPVTAPPEPEKPAEAEKQATAEPEAKPVQMEDVQKKVVELSAAGKKADVRAIVKEYAERVSGIPADKLSEVWSRLSALEG